jgi:hypothetical protein
MKKVGRTIPASSATIRKVLEKPRDRFTGKKATDNISFSLLMKEYDITRKKKIRDIIPLPTPSKKAHTPTHTEKRNNYVCSTSISDTFTDNI